MRIAATCAAIAMLSVASCTSDGGAIAPGRSPAASPTRPVFKRAYLRDACELPPQWVKLIRRGWAPGKARDLDLILVPEPPNYMGTFINTSHSGPYDFLQEVPLVFYGPGFVEPQGRVTLDREVTLADLAPTYATLMDFDFPRRAGTPITEIFKDVEAPPALILTLVIDGGGWNVLDHWPESWPNLKRLIDEGANIEDAIVGSSPSITPATHTNISTGTFPRFHGNTAIAVRLKDGSIVGAFARAANYTGPDVDPTLTLRKTTIGDLWDRARNNDPKVGLMASGNYPLGMLGRGAALGGADHDIATLVAGEGWATNPEFYSVPEYLNTELPGPAQDLEAVDRADGRADGKWLGNELKPLASTPALAPWQNRALKTLLEREGFGSDAVTDLFYVNYKSPDHAGHQWNMIAPQQRDVLKSVDAALRDVVTFLDETIGRDEYLIVVTADHGQTPLEAGGWPINRDEIVADINARFDRVENDKGIIQRTSATSFFSNLEEMQNNKVRPEQVASFISRYTIGENVPDDAEVPEPFEQRRNERIFAAVFPGRQFSKVYSCTLGR